MEPNAKCRGCKKPIIWATTEAGKAIPLDPPEKRFILQQVVPDDPQKPAYWEARLRETYVSHFVSCPQADAFRGKGK